MTRPMATPSGVLAGAGPGGPDGMGREIAQGPDAVAVTLANVAAQESGIIELLARSGRITLIGTGASLAMSRIAAPLWRVAGNGDRELIVRQATELALGGLDGLTVAARDLVVAISQSGSSPETLAAAQVARQAGASVLALTAHLDSALGATATLSVEVASGKEAGAATKSAIASLAALLAVAATLPSDPEGIRAVGEHLAQTSVAAWRDALDAAARLAEARNVWMLGFGAAGGVAEAAMLLWHEKVAHPATAATPSEFRHGLIEAVRPEDVVVLLGTFRGDSGEGRYTDRLRAELVALDVPVVELRPTADHASIAALELLLRVQELARAAALAGGTYREDFAILRHVVRPADDLRG